MKWLHNQTAKIGDTREVVRFAFFPTVCGDYVVWLEKYISIEEYNRWCIDEMHGWIDGWQVKDKKAFI